jgi:ribosomal protein S18 acetylase RimI-like enzyme
LTVRAARLADLAALLAIERASFATDRLTPRAMRRLLVRGKCAMLVAATGGVVVGYALVLFRRGASRARLYSIAVDPSHRRSGIARRLLAAAERRAAARGTTTISLEVGVANNSAVNLYRENGYRLVSRLGAYYADGSAADRWTKTLAKPRR